MRPNHKNNNNRMRGRHRKQSNPLTRSYESNGPDIKVRGTPQHIVEKYAQLARDAQVSGDPVLAEAYLQHAEHYFRIISAAQQEIARQQGFGRPGEAPEAEEGDDEGDDDFANGQLYPTLRPPQQAHQQGGFQRHSDPAELPQPDGQPFVPRERPAFDRQDRGERQDNRQDRGERPDRANFDRGEGGEPRGDRPERGDRPDRGDRQNRNRFQRNRNDFRDRRPPGDGGEPAAVDTSLPAFITGGVPRPVTAEAPEPVESAPVAEGGAEHGEARHPFRQRRRRRFGAEGDVPEAGPEPRGEPVE